MPGGALAFVLPQWPCFQRQQQCHLISAHVESFNPQDSPRRQALLLPSFYRDDLNLATWLGASVLPGHGHLPLLQLCGDEGSSCPPALHVVVLLGTQTICNWEGSDIGIE